MEGCPPVKSPSDGYPLLESDNPAFFPGASSETEEHKEDSRRAPGRLNVTDNTGTSGPKPEIPGAIGFSDFFCL